MTAAGEAAPAPPCPGEAVERDKAHAWSALRAPRVVCPLLRANRDEFIEAVGAMYLLVTLQCYSPTSWPFDTS